LTAQRWELLRGKFVASRWPDLGAAGPRLGLELPGFQVSKQAHFGRASLSFQSRSPNEQEAR
jgi:hypothetical protein